MPPRLSPDLYAHPGKYLASDGRKSGLFPNRKESDGLYEDLKWDNKSFLSSEGCNLMGLVSSRNDAVANRARRYYRKLSSRKSDRNLFV